MMTRLAQDQQLSSYDFHLPPELIAQVPAKRRRDARLLVYDQEKDTVTHGVVSALPHFLPQETRLVFNNTQVIKARVLGQKSSSGKVEALFLGTQGPRYEVMLKSSGKKRVGDKLLWPEDYQSQIVELTQEGTFLVDLTRGGRQADCDEFLSLHGQIPLPPYIRDGRGDQEDERRYQTVFAQTQGSVAAPTAGLHFDEELIQEIQSHGHRISQLSLHIGPGTFRPVEQEVIEKQVLHREHFELSQKTWEELKGKWGDLLAVGTTSLRTLETLERTLLRDELRVGSEMRDHQGERGERLKVWSEGQQIKGETNLFLRPGRSIKSIKGLMTNFHLPKSSLLMLVSAFIGLEKTKELYQLAIKERYRFYSYGDAMLILGHKEKKGV